MRKFFFNAVILSLVIITVMPALARAQEYNHTITVYAVVPEQRIIYIDDSGSIVKVAGNTSNNISPKVVDPKYNEVSITPSIQNQYADFLAQNKNRLVAGKTYILNPVKVVTSSESLTIKIDLSGLTLGSGRNG